MTGLIHKNRNFNNWIAFTQLLIVWIRLKMNIISKKKDWILNCKSYEDWNTLIELSKQEKWKQFKKSFYCFFSDKIIMMNELGSKRNNPRNSFTLAWCFYVNSNSVHHCKMMRIISPSSYFSVSNHWMMLVKNRNSG